MQKSGIGQGGMRRSLLLRILDQLPALPASKRAEMAQELQQTQRIGIHPDGHGRLAR